MKKLIAYFKNQKFRKKLFLSYVLVVIIPVLFLGIFSYAKSKELVQQQLKSGMNDTINQIVFNINSKLERQDDFIKAIAFNASLRKYLSSDESDLMNIVNELNDNFEPSVWYYISINTEIQEVVLYSERYTKALGSFIEPASKAREEKWYKKAKEMPGTYWFFKEGAIYAAKSVKNDDIKSFIGILLVKFNFDKILASITETGLNGNVIICDDDEEIVYAYEPYRHENEDTERRIIAAKKESIAIGNYRYTILKSKLDKPGWYVYFYFPADAVAANSLQILKVTATLVIVCFVSVLLIILLLSKTFTKRINILNDKMGMVEKGNLEIDVSSDSTDEIGELSNRFGKMLKEIRNLINEVYHEKISRKEAELEALQARINPHFLYNSLSIIKWKAVWAKQMDIGNIASLLSKFYRTSLNKGKNICTIRDEIENIKSYMEIQKVMHENSIDVVYEIQENILDYFTVNFILQPIVENSIIHGIDEKEGGGGILKLSAFEEDGRVVFIVEDNGKGMNENQVANILNKDSGGYGIKNVNERIRLYFGNDYGITVSSVKGSGTKVNITIPICEKDN